MQEERLTGPPVEDPKAFCGGIPIRRLTASERRMPVVARNPMTAWSVYGAMVPALGISRATAKVLPTTSAGVLRSYVPPPHNRPLPRPNGHVFGQLASVQASVPA